MAKARTEAQQLASRLNGQKSRGPKTDEGKAIAARNALKHGLNSPDVVLWCENKEEYELGLQALKEEWQPQSLTELQYITAIAQCNWRLRRLMMIETATLDFHMHRTLESFDETLPGYDEQTRLALAWQDLATQTGSLGQIQRHEAHLRRTVERSISKLLAIGESRRRHAARTKKEGGEPWTLNGLPEATRDAGLGIETTPICENEPEQVATDAIVEIEKCENEPEAAADTSGATAPMPPNRETPEVTPESTPEVECENCENEPENEVEPPADQAISFAEYLRRHPRVTFTLTSVDPRDKAA